MRAKGRQDTIIIFHPCGASARRVPAAMSQRPSDSVDSAPNRTAQSNRVPGERFWPYEELPEEPTPEELAALDPELHAALFGTPPGPFSISLEFPPFDGADYERAVELARRAPQYRELGAGDRRRHRATYFTKDARALRELFEIVGTLDALDVLVDGRPVPGARELWLPLVWLLVR